MFLYSVTLESLLVGVVNIRNVRSAMVAVNCVAFN
jgi:hypothetical protein